MDPTDKVRTAAASTTPPAAPSSFAVPDNSAAGIAGSPATPARTGPLPEDGFAGWDGGPDPITALREYNAAGEWELPREIRRFTLGGSRSCDIAIPGRGLSATHCLLERRAKLRIYDQHSTHGTFVRDYKIDSYDLNPGELFSPRPITLVAMNDEMREHRPTLVEIVGFGFTRSPDWLMVEAATSSGHLLITGEAGCDLERLADAIHRMSLRRKRKIVEVATIPDERAARIALVKQASKTATTLVLTITANGAPLDPMFTEMLFSASYGVRVIVLAPSTDAARNALTEPLAAKLQHVPVRPLAYRTVEIGQLLDRMLAERQIAQRTADLTRSNQEALRSYDWPGNLAELRQIADAIAAHTIHGGLRPAAKSLGLTHQTLQRHFARVGLEFPLFG